GNGSNAGGEYLDFSWSSAKRATDYKLQIASDSGFSNLIYDQWLGGQYIGVNNLGSFPDIGEQYWWRVKARNSLGEGSWSNEWSFINGPSNPCSPPVSGNWTVTESCIFEGTATAPADVIVNSNVVLTISDSAVLNIDFVNHKLLIQEDGGVLIIPGGKISQ
ncbi:MAG: hypothetical protein GY845_15145, partial [Planctomycetes bacterium]|nr:hypothetical protein [Planctomycetota bacterium]